MIQKSGISVYHLCNVMFLKKNIVSRQGHSMWDYLWELHSWCQTCCVGKHANLWVLYITCTAADETEIYIYVSSCRHRYITQIVHSTYLHAYTPIHTRARTHTGTHIYHKDIHMLFIIVFTVDKLPSKFLTPPLTYVSNTFMLHKVRTMPNDYAHASWLHIRQLHDLLCPGHPIAQSTPCTWKGT
jgi:hypothetical protein